MTARQHALAPGARVGKYEIESFLGAGGMGEVYVARDSSLGRRVALKVLPRECSPERVARFQREAQASSALNHPAIVSVHDAGSADGVHFLAMELIDGAPLSDWVNSRSNPERAVQLLAQVADGLARAHAEGIVHRDLKPANIMVSRDGYAKIVDFGIAKLTEREVAADAATQLKTASGSVMGTAPYMSPEQVDGRDADHRSDVFSFGTVLFEALSGKHPFSGTTAVETMHNITHRDPPLEQIPALYRRIVRRCLAREPEERYQSMKDVAHELRDAAVEPQSAPARARSRVWIPALALLLVAAAAAIFWLRPRSAKPLSPVAPAATMTRLTNTGNISAATVSPDGKFAVYSMRDGEEEAIWIKQLSSGTATRITPPNRDIVQQILVSPDANYIYFIVSMYMNANVGHLYQVPFLGGTPRRIATDTEFVFTLSPDGKSIAFRRYNAGTRIQALTILDTDTGAERVLLKRTSPAVITAPTWSPDGSTIAFTAGFLGKTGRWLEEVSPTDGAVRRAFSDLPERNGVSSLAWLPDGSGLLATVLDDEQPPQVWIVPRSGTPRKVTSDLSGYYSATPTADGNTFIALRGEGSPTLSVLRMAGDGTAAIVASGLGYDSASGLRTSGTLGISFVSARGVAWLDAGHLIYAGQAGGRTTLMVVPVTGGEPRPLIRNMNAVSASVMPDTQRIMFLSNHSGVVEVWMANIDGTNPRQVTSGAGAAGAAPSPDGKFIYYSTSGRGQVTYRIPSEGGQPVKISDVPSGPPQVSPDGKTILCRRRVVLDDGTATFRTAVISAEDGRLIRTYPLPTRGGALLRWHPSGRAYVAPDSPRGIGNLWQQDLDGSAPRPITNFSRRSSIYALEWSRDGKSIALLHAEPRNDAVLIRNFR